MLTEAQKAMAERFMDRWRRQPESATWPETAGQFSPSTDLRKLLSSLERARDQLLALTAELRAIQQELLSEPQSPRQSDAPQAETSDE
jgi:hypothetical protein